MNETDNAPLSAPEAESGHSLDCEPEAGPAGEHAGQDTGPAPEPALPAPGTVLQTHALPPVAPPKKRSRKWIFAGGGLVGLCLCLCLGALFVRGGISRASAVKPEAEQTVGAFMQAMADGQLDRAYSLLAEDAQITRDELAASLEGNDYVLFEGYEGVTVANLVLRTGFTTGDNMPQGTVAEVSGTIAYRDGFEGNFNALLLEEGDAWRIFMIGVVVPPDKFSS